MSIYIYLYIYIIAPLYCHLTPMKPSCFILFRCFPNLSLPSRQPCTAWTATSCSSSSLRPATSCPDSETKAARTWGQLTWHHRMDQHGEIQWSERVQLNVVAEYAEFYGLW